nr:hypothetical protein [Streptomyces sp. 2321.6]
MILLRSGRTLSSGAWAVLGGVEERDEVVKDRDQPSQQQAEPGGYDGPAQGRRVSGPDGPERAEDGERGEDGVAYEMAGAERCGRGPEAAAGGAAPPAHGDRDGRGEHREQQGRQPQSGGGQETVGHQQQGAGGEFREHHAAADRGHGLRREQSHVTQGGHEGGKCLPSDRFADGGRQKDNSDEAADPYCRIRH